MLSLLSSLPQIFRVLFKCLFYIVFAHPETLTYMMYCPCPLFSYIFNILSIIFYLQIIFFPCKNVFSQLKLLCSIPKINFRNLNWEASGRAGPDVLFFFFHGSQHWGQDRESWRHRHVLAGRRALPWHPQIDVQPPSSLQWDTGPRDSLGLHCGWDEVLDIPLQLHHKQRSLRIALRHLYGWGLHIRQSSNCLSVSMHSTCLQPAVKYPLQLSDPVVSWTTMSVHLFHFALLNPKHFQSCAYGCW